MWCVRSTSLLLLRYLASLLECQIARLRRELAAAVRSASELEEARAVADRAHASRVAVLESHIAAVTEELRHARDRSHTMQHNNNSSSSTSPRTSKVAMHQTNTVTHTPSHHTATQSPRSPGHSKRLSVDVSYPGSPTATVTTALAEAAAARAAEFTATLSAQVDQGAVPFGAASKVCSLR